MQTNSNPQTTPISIEDKYTQLSDIDHVLQKTGVYIGSIYNTIVTYNLYKPSDNKIVRIENVGYNAGLLKLFDEVVSNSVDERRRASRLFDITEIKVHIEKNGTITVTDNGGIPVVEHKVLKMMVPKMIFGTLKTSSNYVGDREGTGTNGLGAKLTNIFSKWFQVTTADGKNIMDIKWINNMKDVEYEKVESLNALNIKNNLLSDPFAQNLGTSSQTDNFPHFTQIKWQIELERFDLTELDTATIRIMQKRCIDACASNPGLVIKFSSDIAEGKLDSTWNFASFKEFVKMHLDPEQAVHITEYKSITKKDEVLILPNINYNFGFVNGSACSEGTHIDKIQKQISDRLLEVFRKKDMELLTAKDITNAYSIFMLTNIINPDYDSQTKDKLTNKIPKEALILSKEFLQSLEDSEIVKQITDFYQAKYAAEQKKNLRKLNALIKTTKSKKLIQCSNKNDRTNNEIILFEGTSAANGFREHGNPANQACYLLKGKVKNTLNLSKDEIVQNIELREIIAALGLQFGDVKGNIKNCNFHKIIFGTDMDLDGHHICGLLLTFFAKHFPELFVAGYIYRMLSPIIIAEKNGVEKMYYSDEEFKVDEPNLKGWDIAYKKGLGALEDRHYETMLQQQRLIQFSLTKDYMNVINIWFDKSTTQRKALLLTERAYDEDDAA